MEYKRKDRVTIKCKICKKEFKVNPARKNRKYCSQKCMGLQFRKDFVQRNPQYRSYGECGLIVLFKKNFKNLKFIANDRKQLGGYEMDIWIPHLKVGIEYNGPHHFKPVYGQKVFEHTKKSDRNKRIIARRKGIKIIDVNVMNTIFKTHPTRLRELFGSVCQQLKLIPTNLEITPQEVIDEQKKR